MKKRSAIAASVISGLVLAAVLAIAGSRGTTADEVWHQARIGNAPLAYSVGFDEGGHAAVYFQYGMTSAQAVREVAAAMTNNTRSLVEQGKTVESEIVFTHPIPIDEYIALMRDLGLTPTTNLLEGQDARGWVSIGAPPAKDGTAIDRAGLARFLDGDKLGAQPVGVVTAQGVALDAETFNRVTHDPRVFAVPAMRALIDNEIVAKYPTVDVERMFVQPSRLYHAMKVAGIAAPYPSPVTVEDTGVPAGADGAH